MENKLIKKYGLFTAICMVVGIVVGSGIFFKAQDILNATEGNLKIGVLAWLIGGAIMLACLLAFSFMAQRYEKVNGIVDYAEALVGKKYAYYMGWFSTFIYYPAMTSVLAWVSARYTLVFITSANPNFPMTIPASEGGCIIGPECMVIMMFYLCMSYVVNSISPKLAGKFQTTTTVIKFIPLVLMAVVGIVRTSARWGLRASSSSAATAPIRARWRCAIRAFRASAFPAPSITTWPTPK